MIVAGERQVVGVQEGIDAILLVAGHKLVDYGYAEHDGTCRFGIKLSIHPRREKHDGGDDADDDGIAQIVLKHGDDAH